MSPTPVPQLPLTRAAPFSAITTGALSGIILDGHDAGGFVDPDGNHYDLDGYTHANSLVPLRAVIIDRTGGLGGALGDTNGDGVVDLQDLLNVKNNFGLPAGPGILGDTNNDGVINLQDLLNVKNY